MFDPSRYAEWMQAVTSVEVLDAALAPGARVRHRGSFMGRELTWMTTVETVHFPHVLVLQVTEGPFVGVTRIGIQRSGEGSRVQVQNSGELKGLGFIPDMMVAGPMKTALAADLERLKVLVEG